MPTSGARRLSSAARAAGGSTITDAFGTGSPASSITTPEMAAPGFSAMTMGSKLVASVSDAEAQAGLAGGEGHAGGMRVGGEREMPLAVGEHRRDAAIGSGAHARVADGITRRCCDDPSANRDRRKGCAFRTPR